MNLKPGDKIRLRPHISGPPRDRERKVKYVGTDWIIYESRYVHAAGSGEPQELCINRRDFEIKFEPVPDFFEEGKKYTNSTGIATYTFEVESVKENRNSLTTQAAFGLLTRTGSASETFAEWVLYTNMIWNSGKWSEMKDV